MFEDISNPPGIPGIGFLAANGFYILGMSKNNLTGRFKHIVDGNPVLACGFHASIPASVVGEPLGKQAEVTCESRKPVPFVSRNALAIGCRDTSDDEGFVDVIPQQTG